MDTDKQAGVAKLIGAFQEYANGYRSKDIVFIGPCIVMNFRKIKPTRCINFSNLFWK